MKEAVPPQAHQNSEVPIEETAMLNVEIKSAFYRLTQVLATQFARNTRVQVYPNPNTTA